ncbi:hypothetical protein HXX76_015103 [Chlamydomonas incerta]|uniref:C-type lectin domain-containing protein n=1 Tax=Chlamydomonas incerta TaxID=51695 RepID=A0A835SAH6_CHLIN|nr:hypothetical protein HXX76_015103 [Chlamydomonas incerta]|eukprot:KAG2423713.1 hypothetical protein HXX76_015103 [Chlamydomonas incerta]
MIGGGHRVAPPPAPPHHWGASAAGSYGGGGAYGGYGYGGAGGYYGGGGGAYGSAQQQPSDFQQPGVYGAGGGNVTHPHSPRRMLEAGGHTAAAATLATGPTLDELLDGSDSSSPRGGARRSALVKMVSAAACSTPKLTWDDARAACRAASGADLARALGYSGAVWIGLSDVTTEGTWAWVNGATFSSTLHPGWAVGEPANTASKDCVALDVSRQAWVVRACTDQLQYICEGASSQLAGCGCT